MVTMMFIKKTVKSEVAGFCEKRKLFQKKARLFFVFDGKRSKMKV